MNLIHADIRTLRHPALPGILRRMEAGEWRELRRSVERLGVRVPVLVSPEDTGYRILDGLRRVAAAQLAGHQRVPALVLGGEELHDLPGGGAAVVTLLANAVRDRNPVAEYLAIQALRAAGMTNTDIARALGVDRTTVAKRLRLERVRPELLEEAEAGRVPYAVLRALPSYPEHVQDEVLRRVRAGERVRVADLRTIAAADTVAPAGGQLDALAGAAEAMGDPVARARVALAGLRAALARLDLGEREQVVREALREVEAAIWAAAGKEVEV